MRDDSDARSVVKAVAAGIGVADNSYGKPYALVPIRAYIPLPLQCVNFIRPGGYSAPPRDGL
jgi:hypothetical protein